MPPLEMNARYVLCEFTEYPATWPDALIPFPIPLDPPSVPRSSHIPLLFTKTCAMSLSFVPDAPVVCALALIARPTL